MREPKNFLKVFQKLSFSWFDNIIDEMTRVIELLGEVHKCSVKKFRIIRTSKRTSKRLYTIRFRVKKFNSCYILVYDGK